MVFEFVYGEVGFVSSVELVGPRCARLFAHSFAACVTLACMQTNATGCETRRRVLATVRLARLNFPSAV